MSFENKQGDEIYALYQAKSPEDVWIDVRQPEEWEEGVIPGIQTIMLSELEDHFGGLSQDKTYIIVCRSGMRSARACESMADVGFKKLINFEGGMLAWYEANYPTD